MTVLCPEQAVHDRVSLRSGRRTELEENREGSQDDAHEDPAIKYLSESMDFTTSQAREIMKRHREYPMEDGPGGGRSTPADGVHCG